MVTVVRQDYGPDPRAQAFEQALAQMTQGFGNIASGVEKGKAKQLSAREKAFDILSKRAQAGQEITPEMEQSAYEAAGYDPNQKWGLDVFKNEQAGPPQRDSMIEALNRDAQAISQRRQLEGQRESEMYDLNKRYKEAQIENMAQKSQPTAMTPAQKLEKMGAEAKSKVGGIAEGFRGLTQIEQALEGGLSPQYITPETPVIGQFVSDNPLTSAQRVLTDVVGRLQSGGAINSDEERRFLSMGPRPGDSPEEAVRKVREQRAFLENKLRAYGLSSADLGGLGFETQPIMGDVKQQNVADLSMLSPRDQVPYNPTPQPNLGMDAVAAPAINHPQANEAMGWARKNPNDPRAQQIMQRFGGQ